MGRVCCTLIYKAKAMDIDKAMDMVKAMNIDKDKV